VLRYTNSIFESLLGRWLQLGVLICLVGLMCLPSFSAYKNLIYIFLYLPALILMFSNQNFLEQLKSKLTLLFVSFVLLGAVSVYWSDSGDELTRVKRVLFVLLFAAGVIACEYLKPKALEELLYLGAAVAAVSAGYALYSFYFVESAHLFSRMSGYGLLDHSILSVFVYGFFCIVAIVALLDQRVGPKFSIVLGLSAVVLILYIFSTHTRGGIAALFCALVVYLGVSKSTLSRVVGVCILFVFMALGVYLFDSLVSRGVSLRPDLWLAGYDLAMQAPWLGHGVGSDYNIMIGLRRSFDHPHNMLVNILLDVGWVGLILWLSLYGWLLQHLIRSSLKVRGLAISLLTFAFVAALFDGDGPFVRPRAVWFISWVPLLLSISWVLLQGRMDSKKAKAHV